MSNIVLLASGSGSNVVQIIHYFKDHKHINVTGVVSNRKEAPVIDKAHQLGKATQYWPKNQWANSLETVEMLQQMKADYIVLAGFLLLLTKDIIQAFPNRIINIHPSLLPAYGGKGMYGMHVHNAVYSNREKETGITIHLVNENYDEGTILCQKKCNIEHCHSPEDIQKAVQKLEHSFFGPEIDKYISSHALQ